jgi:hypothetical protein
MRFVSSEEAGVMDNDLLKLVTKLQIENDLNSYINVI